MVSNHVRYSLSRKVQPVPLYGHCCVNSSESVFILRHTNWPQCVWNCLRLEACRYINHNHTTRQCDLGLSKCEFLVPVVDGVVGVYGKPRDNCVQWRPSQEPGRVPVQASGNHVARIKITDTLLVGKFYSWSWVLVQQWRHTCRPSISIWWRYWFPSYGSRMYVAMGVIYIGRITSGRCHWWRAHVWWIHYLCS